MKNEEGKNMNFAAERGTVEKKQGSRGSVAERNLYAKKMKNQWKKHTKINAKSIKNEVEKSMRKKPVKSEVR